MRTRSGVINTSDLPREISNAVVETRSVDTVVSRRRTSDVLFERMVVGGESFWTVVYEPFMSRDMTRDDLRALISRGLEQTRGSYRILVQLFNMPDTDYKRFLNFLRKHDCQIPFKEYR